MALLFAWSFVMATPLAAFANPPAKSKIAYNPGITLKKLATNYPAKLSPPSNANCLKPLPDSFKFNYTPKVKASISLMGKVAKLNTAISESQINTWK